MHQLCQLCFFITSFENMSTLPNFAQLCPTMHFSHSLHFSADTGCLFTDDTIFSCTIKKIPSENRPYFSVETQPSYVLDCKGNP